MIRLAKCDCWQDRGGYPILCDSFSQAFPRNQNPDTVPFSQTHRSQGCSLTPGEAHSTRGKISGVLLNESGPHELPSSAGNSYRDCSFGCLHCKYIYLQLLLSFLVASSPQPCLHVLLASNLKSMPSPAPPTLFPIVAKGITIESIL